MKKHFIFLVVLFTLSVMASAQMLSQVTVKDQFDSGSRGGDLSLTNGGTEYYSLETISNINGVTGTIIYKNA
jgi:hypothetical protein